MNRVLLFFIVLRIGLSFGQSNNYNVSQKLLNTSFEKPEQVSTTVRKLPVFKKKSSLFNPLNYLGVGFLFVYQNIFSEQIQASCVYHTSCSEYTKLSIAQHGIFIGTLKGFNQLSECAASAKYEHPPVCLDNEGKIINRFEESGK